VSDDQLWDAIIVGQGLAGTTLAWHLILAGQRVLVLDAEAPVTSSKIAAGLITPITGQRMALSWRNDEFLPVAQQFYRTIEQRTGHRFYHTRTAVRLFGSEDDRKTWSKRLQQPGYAGQLLVPQPNPLLASDIADTSNGGFAMHAAQLDVGVYLGASRSAFQAMGAYLPMTLDWQADVKLGGGVVEVQHLRSKRLISCEGYAASRNPYFAHVPFNAAKGDILTVRFHQPIPYQSLHRDLWVAPTAEADVFRIGSSYNWADLDEVPSPAARADIERKLQALVRIPYTVLHHQAAVRPIIHQSKAMLGTHPQYEQLGYFNGLGSKGSFHAPWFANCYTEHLLNGTPLPEASNVRKFNINGQAANAPRH
jgi:glycine oxidase